MTGEAASAALSGEQARRCPPRAAIVCPALVAKTSRSNNLNHIKV